MRPGIALSLLMMSVIIGHAADQKKWYEEELSFSGYTHVADFELKGNESKEITIESDQPLWVTYGTPLTAEDLKKYKSIEYPIRMEQKEKPHIFCSAAGWAGTVFSPIQGAIRVKVINNTPDTIKFVVGKKKAAMIRHSDDD